MLNRDGSNPRPKYTILKQTFRGKNYSKIQHGLNNSYLTLLLSRVVFPQLWSVKHQRGFNQIAYSFNSPIITSKIGRRTPNLVFALFRYLVMYNFTTDLNQIR